MKHTALLALAILPLLALPALAYYPDTIQASTDLQRSAWINRYSTTSLGNELTYACNNAQNTQGIPHISIYKYGTHTRLNCLETITAEMRGTTMTYNKMLWSLDAYTPYPLKISYASFTAPSTYTFPLHA